MSSISIPFLKASACGNDFLLVEAEAAAAQLNELARQVTAPGRKVEDVYADLTRRMCERHEGVGADGVEWLSSDPDADVRARLINADGSPAEISGNGTRCVAAYMVSRKGGGRITVRTDAGVKTCILTGRDGHRYEFETAMGSPEVGDAFSIRLAFGEITGVPVSMGNPHFVIFVDQFAPGWQAEAAEIGRHHDFKHGINVELVRIDNRHAISALFFERGAGETQSSGTGSCASVVASIVMGKVESPVEVHTAGGLQVVRWERLSEEPGQEGREHPAQPASVASPRVGEGEVYLRGSATILCQGEFFVG